MVFAKSVAAAYYSLNAPLCFGREATTGVVEGLLKKNTRGPAPNVWQLLGRERLAGEKQRDKGCTQTQTLPSLTCRSLAS